ncbi:MAG: pyruvate carboxylase [Thiotrichales bacterium]|nr:pyruvate carboxylase [Thiotrichales bacterium]
MSGFRKILVANRGEIAIRVLRAANEMGKATVAVFSGEDRLALHRSKADESYHIGEGMGPSAAYLSVDELLRVARATGTDAIHPGYGFLSESPEFAEACATEEIAFIGPRPDTLRRLGDKVSARAIAAAAGVPTVPATGPLPADPKAAREAAKEVGFPGILKASWGGGGRGMRVVETPEGFEAALLAARREAAAAFGKDDIYLERFIPRARHLEVQVLADAGGRIVHLFERDCSVQRRNQKIVECAPAPGLAPGQREALTGYALAIARKADYLNAGTVEFLHDIDTGRFHFIEVNPRIQVEHTVTEQVTGVDLVRAQIRIAEGGAIGDGPDAACPPQDALALRGHAVQCRITTEDPLDRFIPDYGRITAYRAATGFGIRLDGGTAYSGAVITRHYDSLLEKITAWAPSREGAIGRMRRALREFRIRGVATNIAFLERLVGDEVFRDGQVTTRFIDDNPDLLAFTRPRDRASRLLRYIAETTINGHPEVKDRPLPPAHARNPRPPDLRPASSAPGTKAAPGSANVRPDAGGSSAAGAGGANARPDAGGSSAAGAGGANVRPDAGGSSAAGASGTNVRPDAGGSSAAGAGSAKALLDAEGPAAVAAWMLGQTRVLVTDTTMRDAPQSLLATRMRTHDMARIAPAYARNLPDLFSLECWGGATFDVAMRFLGECPWERLRRLRAGIPNLLLQMLLRASNAVGYTNYPDNVVRGFVARAAASGIDLFRIFDPLNSVENMRVAVDAVLESGRICEAAICYTGDLHDPQRRRYDLGYYVRMARELRDAGTHILGIKDMGGLVKPAAARVLVEALKAETGLPVHFHTHDTSGIAAASVLAAVDNGVDAVDLAMDSLSGFTSQPCLGSVVEALRSRPRDTGLDPARVREISDYWEAVRAQYAAFETDMRAPASEVYLHEMPGGQFTNLREQARSLGLAERWHEVASAYAEVNRMFGDIVKVTPTSKVVGDMALVMVSGGLTRADVEDPDRDIAFPESVVGLFRGELGRMPGGFPEPLARKILKGTKPIEGRPGALLPAADLETERARAEAATGWSITDEELWSWLLYPRVFADYAERRGKYGPVSALPTEVFFYGLRPGREVSVELDRGLTLVIRCLAVGETDEEGAVRVFYELNGQPRSVKVENREATASAVRRPKADPADPCHVAAPMPGVVASLAVAEGRTVVTGDLLMTIEAMKMETALHAERDGTVAALHVAAGQSVEAKDLLLEFTGDSAE